MSKLCQIIPNGYEQERNTGYFLYIVTDKDILFSQIQDIDNDHIGQVSEGDILRYYDFLRHNYN